MRAFYPRPMLSRGQMEESLVRLLAPDDARRFRDWLATLPGEVLSSEHETVTETVLDPLTDPNL